METYITNGINDIITSEITKLKSNFNNINELSSFMFINEIEPHNLSYRTDLIKTFEDLIRPIDRGEAIMTYLQALEIQPILKEKASFPDITDHKARGYIEKAKEMGIVEGHPDGNFKPNDTINRAEFAAIAYRVIE